MSQTTQQGRAARSVILALAGLALSGLLAMGASVLWLRSSDAESVPAVGALAANKTLGINTDLSRLDERGREQALAAIEAAGLQWVRQRFPWDVIEPDKGVYDWAIWDRIVDDVEGYGLQLIAVLDGSPPWSRSDQDAGNPLAPPTETRDFGDFAAAFAERYGDRIQYYQIWDEPNIAPHWGAREIDPAAYGRLLREGSIRVRAAAPAAVILLAALAPNVEPGGANMSEVQFLEKLYEQGAAEWFDVVAGQPYDFGGQADALPEAGMLNWNRVSLLRDVMERNGDGGSAVWAVSFGSSGAGSESVGGLLELARENWPWLGPMLWAGWTPEDAHGEYALTDHEGRVGPVYETLKEFASAPIVAWPGNYPADHPSGRYEGDWRVTPSGSDNGRDGDSLWIPFRGTRLDLTVRRGAYRAFLFVSVDGEPANALPRDGEGRAYVGLYDPLLQTSSVILAKGLPDGDHLARIDAERGWGQWTIVGWTVSRELDAHVMWAPGLLGLGALVVLALTAVVSWPKRRLLVRSCGTLAGRYRALDFRWALVITGAAAILVYASAGTLPTLAAMGLLSILLLLRPEMGLPLIAAALPFYQPGVALFGKIFSIVEILILCTALGWAVRRVITREFKLPRPTSIDWGVIVLVVIGLLSLAWADHLRVAAREFRTVVLEGAIYYGLIRAMAQGRRHAWRIADAWVLGGSVIALIGVCQWAFGQNLITAEGVWRVRGFYGSPNNLALYLGRLFPLAFAVSAFASGSPSEGTGRRTAHRRWAYALAAVIMAVALFFTYSRGAWLLGVPASLLFLAALRGWRTFAVTALLLSVAVVAGVLVVGTGRVMSLLDSTEGTTFFRLQLWQSSWAMIRDHPVLGVGLDNFLYHYRSTYVLPTAWEEFNLSHPHNLVLDFWLRLGLPGLGAVVWLLVEFYREAWRLYRRLPEGYDKLLVLGLMGGMVSFVAHGLVDNAFFLVDLACVFSIMLALVQIFEPGESRSGA